MHLAALVSALGWLAAGASVHDALVVAISVLIVTCPCAVALAVPAVQVVAAGALFRLGVLLNRGDAIERLAEVDTIVFDKTGTLTLPDPALEGDAPADLAGRRGAAGAVEPSSARPRARRAGGGRGALSPTWPRRRRAGSAPMVEGLEARLGALDFCGVAERRASFDEGLSRVGFRWGERTAVFRLRQALRPDAVAVVGGARAPSGYAVEILSGDGAARGRGGGAGARGRALARRR